MEGQYNGLDPNATAPGPVVAEPQSRLPWIIGGVVLAVILVLGLIVGLSAGGGASDDALSATDLESDADAGDARPGGLSPIDEGDLSDTGQRPENIGSPEPDEPEPDEPQTTDPPVTAGEAAAGDLINESPTVAIDSWAQDIGAPFLAAEILLYPDYAFLQYQDPANAGFLNEYEYRDGVNGPEPVVLTSSEYEDLPNVLFSPEDINFDAIPALAQQALGSFGLDSPEVTHVIIDRFTFNDGLPTIRIYVDDPVRGGGGYMVAQADGTFVEVVQ